MTRQDWRINIENTAASVATKYGNAVAESIFRRYDATSFEDLSSAYYLRAVLHAQQHGGRSACPSCLPVYQRYDAGGVCGGLPVCGAIPRH